MDQVITNSLYTTNVVSESHSIRSTLAGRPKKKRRKLEHNVPIVFARMRTRKGQPKPVWIRILLDSGASGCIIHKSLVKKLKQKDSKKSSWNTAAGIFQTEGTAKVDFILPEFYESKLISWKAHVTKQDCGYDMIVGRDLLQELGMKIDFDSNSIEWEGASVPMKPHGATRETDLYLQDSQAVEDAVDRMKHILDAKYAKADLDEYVQECDYLSAEEKKQLLALLKQYESLFDGTLGRWKNEKYDIELRPNVEPYHAKAYPIPKSYEKTLRMEVERLCKVGVLKKVNRSEWAAPTFIVPKKDKTVRFITDFRELNKRIKRKPFPTPRIQDMLLKLEGFMHATTLDLNMGYYHIELSPGSKKLCTLVLPWGKYEYQVLPMGLSNSPDIFSEKMGNLMQDLEYVRTYIDDLVVITTGDFNDHLEKLGEVLKRLRDAGLKVNIRKSFFAKQEVEYLGYIITRKGIKPDQKKVDAIFNIATPKGKKDLRRFIGMVNYYRDLWIRRSHVLAPLTKLTGANAKWRWTEVEQNAFDTMKAIVSKGALLAYPDFNQPFDIHTDASHTQLGAVISQKGVPIAFYSRKLNDAQTRYTTTERELLAIVETLKEFRNILLGHRINVYTDHKNLTYKNFNTERVMRWRLILEEYGPELHYIKGEKNIVADALSRLGMKSENPPDCDAFFTQVCLASDEKDELPEDAFPLVFKQIMEAQRKDKSLLLKSKKDPNYRIKSFRGGGKKRNLIVKDDKIVIPDGLQKRTVVWYHQQLCHPGETRTEKSIKQHFYWPNMDKMVKDICKKCPTCQTSKTSSTKYGHLPEKKAEARPWEKLCVDLIGPYKIKQRNGKDYVLWCLTMIDPATGWFEIKECPDKEAITIANLVEQVWLTRYPWPDVLNYDKGKEFMGEFAKMIKEDYGITRRGSTVRNPQANGVIERVHKTIGNMIRTFELDDLDSKDPFGGILAATMFAIRATHHTTLQASPSQLVFGRDAIHNIAFEANWKFIRDRKQAIIHQNNKKENAKRVKHTYRVNDEVLMRNPKTEAAGARKYGLEPWIGPYKVLRNNNNGTLRLQMGAVSDNINIRKLKPYRR